MPLPYELGRFRLLQPLADDGRTAVGLYADAAGQQVTVRTLSDAVAMDPGAQQAFRQGAYAAGPVLEVGHAPDGRPYVVAPAHYAPKQRKVWPIVTAIGAVLVLAAAVVIAIVLTRSGGSDSDQAGPLAPSHEPTSTAPPATPSSTPSSVAPPDTLGTPRVGECRDLPYSAGDALSDDTPTVDCGQHHTALTYYVGRYRGDLADNDYAGYRCGAELPHALGASAKATKLSAYSFVFYQPTKQQWSAGARWFRCDLVLSTTDTFDPLPTDVSPLPRTLPDALAACRTVQARTPCSEPHSMRAVTTITFHFKVSRLPTDSALEAQARTKCPARTTFYSWPGSGDWKYGVRLGVCWRQTTG